MILLNEVSNDINRVSVLLLDVIAPDIVEKYMAAEVMLGDTLQPPQMSLVLTVEEGGRLGPKDLVQNLQQRCLAATSRTDEEQTAPVLKGHLARLYGVVEVVVASHGTQPSVALQCRCNLLFRIGRFRLRLRCGFY